MSAEAPEAPAKEFDENTKSLGDQLVGLTLLQAKALADYLKEVHGIEPAGGGVMVAAPAAAGGDEGAAWQRRTGVGAVPAGGLVPELDHGWELHLLGGRWTKLWHGRHLDLGVDGVGIQL